MLNVSPRQLEVFVHAAASGSLSAAAGRLHLTQPAASMALAEMERLLGSRVFDRVPGGLRLNPRGRDLLPLAQELLERHAEFTRAASDGDHLLAGELRIGTSNTVGNYRVGELLGAFVAAQPEAVIRLQVANTETITQGVLEHALDIGCVEGPVIHPEIEVTPWRDDVLVVCAPPGHPLAGRRRLQAEAFQNARDQADRILLDDDLARLRAKEEDGTLSPLERKILANAEKTSEALANADKYTDPLDPDTKPGGTLWLYDPGAYEGDGRVAVAVGNLDTATDVSLFTPGINTDTQDVSRYTDQMVNLYESARFNGDGSSVATMFWLGYNAPHGPTDLATLTEGRAEEGGRNLADAIDGLRASRSDNPAHMTAIGHSYGSTTTSYAAHGDKMDVDQVVLIGSPGAGPADRADDFGVGRENVYVGRDSRDLVGTFGDEGSVGKFGLGLGKDPSEDNFGANRFQAEDVDRSWRYNTGDAHGSYLDNDSESLYNLGKIIDGHGDEINRAGHTYDPWWGTPKDPEWNRDPTEGEPGKSDTTDRRD